jgi:hypothetical protein
MSELQHLSDFDLAILFHDTMERHDSLIDSADMGDERIYFANKKCDACRAEQERRGYVVCPKCYDFGDVADDPSEYCYCVMGQHFKEKAEKRAATRAAFAAIDRSEDRS